MICIRKFEVVMSIHQAPQLKSSLVRSDVVIRTQHDLWVIPYNCEILKALLLEQKIRARDLKFNSESQCHGFIKRLLLLAAQDECRNCSPSQLATFARELMRYRP